jgi:hypothetical protein
LSRPFLPERDSGCRKAEIPELIYVVLSLLFQIDLSYLISDDVEAELFHAHVCYIRLQAHHVLNFQALTALSMLKLSLP